VKNDNTIKVGDLVEYVLITPVHKYVVAGIHNGLAWLYHEGQKEYYRDPVSQFRKCAKPKDIRTIECAGGAVRITGEYQGKVSGSRIQVRTEEPCHDAYLHWGVEVFQTPSQPH
jgi:hypothetical protein